MVGRSSGSCIRLTSQHPFWGTSSYCWLRFSTYVHLQSSLTQPCTLCNRKIVVTFNLVPIKCTNILMFCPYSSMPWLVHDHFCIPTCAKCIYIIVAVCHPYIPPSDSLSLSSGYWSFMFPCLHYAWAPGNSNNDYTIFALWPVAIHVCPRHTTLGYVEHFSTYVEARFVMSM